MASSLSNLADNLAKEIPKIKFKDCDCFLEYESLKYVCSSCNKDFEKELGEYHDLYLQSNKLLLVDVSKNFRKMCLNIYRLDPAKK